MFDLFLHCSKTARQGLTTKCTALNKQIKKVQINNLQTYNILDLLRSIFDMNLSIYNLSTITSKMRLVVLRFEMGEFKEVPPPLCHLSCVDLGSTSATDRLELGAYSMKEVESKMEGFI